MADNPWTEDQIKGVQGIPIVESPAHFDLSKADVVATRQQGLDITSIRAFHAHAEDRLYETQSVMPNKQARALMQRLLTAWPHLPTFANPRYVLVHAPGKSITLTTLEGQLLYREAGEILIHNRLTQADGYYLSSQLTTVDSITAVQQLMNQVLAHLDRWPSDPAVPLTLTATGERIVLTRANGTTVYEEERCCVVCCDITSVEWQSLTQRLVRITDPAPDPDPGLEL